MSPLPSAGLNGSCRVHPLTQRNKPTTIQIRRAAMLYAPSMRGLAIMDDQALQVDRPAQLPTIKSDAGSLMEVISRAASDPSTDVDKLERLLVMYERITARQAEQAYHDAMSDAQAEMRPIAADANNPQTKSKYASFMALDRALRPIYTKHGFSLSYDTDDGAPADYVRVVCKVSHRQGHTERPRIDMPADGKGAKGGDVMTKTHATGAAMTYGQRYLIKMIFNIAVGEDLDGNDMAGSMSVTEAQRDALMNLADAVKADKRAFCEYMGVASFGEIAGRDYKKAEAALQAKGRRAAKTDAAA